LTQTRSYVIIGIDFGNYSIGVKNRQRRFNSGRPHQV